MNSNLILFDGMCNFCNFWVNFIIDHDRKKIFKFASLQSDAAQNILRCNNPNLLEMDTFVLMLSDNLFTKSFAALQITKKLDGFWKLIYVFSIIPEPLRDLVYDFIARNRYKWFGSRSSCRIPKEEEKERFLTD